MAPEITSAHHGDGPPSTTSDTAGAIRYLLAASPEVSAKSIEKRFVELSPDVVDKDVVVVNNNPGLLRMAHDRWPECDTLPAPKGRSDIRQVLRQFQRLVLYWDGEELTKLLYEARLAQIPTRLIPVQVTRVVNKSLTNEYDVYIGRGSPWGNPFAISRSDDGPDRTEVIERYREHFYEKVQSDQKFAKAILGLRGLRLACFCKPEACHGDIIAEYLDGSE